MYSSRMFRGFLFFVTVVTPVSKIVRGTGYSINIWRMSEWLITCAVHGFIQFDSQRQSCFPHLQVLAEQHREAHVLPTAITNMLGGGSWSNGSW